jgi:hypothetical protein
MIPPSAARFIVWILLSGLGVYLLLPTQGIENVPANLDGSWRLALSVAFEKGLVFGRDINFTYGPLGFLAARALSESTTHLIKAYDLFITIQLILVPWCVYRHARTFSALSLMFAVYYLLAGANYFLDPPIILFLLSTFWLFDSRERFAWWKVALAALNAVLALYIKTNLGLAAVMQILAISLFQLTQRRSRTAAIAQLGFTVGAVVLSTTFLQVDILGYLRASLHIANGYNDAMYMELSNLEYLQSSLIALGVAGACVVVSILFGNQFFLGISCAGFLFLLFKQAFVRSDGHIYVFFDYVFVPLALLAFFTQGWLRWVNSIGLMCLMVGACWIRGDSNMLRPVERVRLKWDSLQGYYRSFEQRPGVPPGTAPISDVFKTIVKQAAIDQIPDNPSILHYAGLNYVPRPVPQSYKSYDRFLDGLNGTFVADRGHPYFLIGLGCIDDRYCFHDETQLKVAMLQHYDVVAAESPFVLVERRGVPLQIETKHVGSGELKLGQRLNIPPSDGLQLVQFDVDYSAIGKVRRVFYKPRSLRIEIGSTVRKKSFRAIVPMLQAGVIANVDVSEFSHLRSFYERRIQDLPKIKTLKVYSKHRRHFNKTFRYRVYEVIIK